MPTGGQIRGMLLEEIVLRLLETAGYRPVDAEDRITIFRGPAGLQLQGRGSRHQIDAIADYRIQQPFSHPQRLLVEAKCYQKEIGLEVVRNAVGVHKDSSEHWSGRAGPRSRFHYQYAVFSATRFSTDAETYAFPQDVYLFPLGRSGYLRPILNEIWRIRTRSLEKKARNVAGFMKDLRSLVRRAIRQHHARVVLNRFLASFQNGGIVDRLLDNAENLAGALLATSKSGFLIFLVPRAGGNLRELINLIGQTSVRIRVQRVRKNRFWFMETANGERLFTLDIPPQLFRLYMSEGSLDRRELLDVKKSEFSALQAVYWLDNEPGVVTFILDQEWINRIEQELG